VAWRWTAWRLAVSAYLVFHLTATVIWIIPGSPLKERVMPAFSYYMIPLGLWQSWWMFAPDPMRSTLVLEAEVIDAKGIRHLHEFTRVADLPWWQKVPRFRHPKFSCNLLNDEYVKLREYSARHAVRELGLGSDSFPLHVSLYYRVTELPPPGVTVLDPMAPIRLHTLATYDFGSIAEVLP
jgi:hypothetical protein